MARSSTNDAVFGELHWKEDRWLGVVAIPYFTGAGDEIVNPLRDEVLRPWGGSRSNAEALAKRGPEQPSPAPFDDENLFGEAKFRLTVAAAERQRAVAQGQRVAWEQIVARGEALWREATDAILADYNIQRSFRVKSWMAMYGELPLERELPAIQDIATLREYCRPYGVHVHPVQKGNATAVVAVHFMCTWIRTGFAVVLRDGQILGVAEHAYMPPPARTMDHPEIGRLNLYGDEKCWHGQTNCDAMLDYELVANYRAKFRIGGVNRDRPQSLVRWRHAHGKFGSYFYVIEPGAGLDDRQVAAWEAFNDDRGKNVATLLSALFEQYQKKWASASFDRVIVDPIQSRREYIDETCPRIDRIEGLRDLIELENVYVHPPDKTGCVRIVFQLHGSYEPEMMVLWRDGAIERFGKWPDRLPGSAR
jgi:hypothetical protein